jgi:hypothetical protein
MIFQHEFQRIGAHGHGRGREGPVPAPLLTPARLGQSHRQLFQGL